MNQKARRINVVETALGDALERGIQAWIRTSGRSVRTAQAPWLEELAGEKRIGTDIYEAHAREVKLEAERDVEAGLLPGFGVLAREGFEPDQVRPEVRRFYERTADYDLRLSYEWSGLLKNPPRTFIYLVGRNIQQVNLPVSSRAADVGISNELVRFVGPAGDDAPYVGWMRRMESTGEVILAGFYGTCELPGREGKFVRGFYPLPGGSATVVFRPTNGPDGSFALVSDGKRFGEEGYYRAHRTTAGTLRVKCLPMAEVVRVFVDKWDALRAEHTFAFGGVRFLTLRYEISRRDRLWSGASLLIRSHKKVYRERKNVTLNEKLLRRLIETPGVPGREEQQREIAREELETLTDEVRTDPLGSIIGTKRGREDVRVMVAAHTDEIGFLVKHIDDKGFLRLQTLGGHDPVSMVSQRVLVTTANGAALKGALQPARKPPHISHGEEQKLPKANDFFVDLGMSAEEVKEAVRIGDYVTMDRTLERVGENYLGKAMDDRIGVFVMLEALRALNGHEATIHAAATSQEEVGLRGATASGSALEPTVVVALDITLAMDIPGAGEGETITWLGNGAAIKIMDSSLICNPKLVEHFRQIAEREEIPHQMEILPAGGTDAGGVQRLHGGIPSITLSIPCRYVHTPNEMVSASDVQACIELLARYLEEAHEGDYAL